MLKIFEVNVTILCATLQNCFSAFLCSATLLCLYCLNCTHQIWSVDSKKNN